MVAGHASPCCASSPRPPPGTRSPASACRARCTARCSSTPPATRSARRCCGTTRAPTPSATRSSARLGRERVIAITGNRASTGFQAPKLLWLRAHEPEAAATARQARAAQGLHPLAADRRARHRRRRRLGHAVPRPAPPPLQRRDAGGARRAGEPAAAGVRGTGGHRPPHRRRGRPDRPAGGHARGRGRRRQCLRRDRRRADRGRPRRLLARHLGHAVRPQHDAARSTRRVRSTPSATRCPAATT